MQRRRDPIVREARDSRDLYDIATWERRSFVDAVAVGLHSLLVKSFHAAVVLLAAGILAALFLLGGLGAVFDPFVGTLVLLAAIPALAIALYVWHADITTGEPLGLLVATFLLAVLFATFAAVVNSLLAPAFSLLPLVGLPLFFFLVVGPVEETVKLLAIRLYAYRSDSFDSVIDGAVYGAVAGLGFATIENAIYITGSIDGAVAAADVIRLVGDVTAVRALAGPGHVIYSAIAGFYLGLAKFNREHAGPIVVKGLLIAAAFHALYNTLVGVVPGLLVAFYGLPSLVAFVGFIVVYDGAVAYFLYRKVVGYRRAYRDAGVTDGEPGDSLPPETTEFDP